MEEQLFYQYDELARKLGYEGDCAVFDHEKVMALAASIDDARELGRHEVLSAITYVGADGGVYNSKMEWVDLREYLK